MFMMQTRSQVKSAADGKKKTTQNRRSISHTDSGGVIQCVRFQYRNEKWNAIGDFDRGSTEVPADVPTEENGVYDTATGEYVSPQEAHRRAYSIIFTARQHQQQRSDIAREMGQPLPPRNRSEMYSTTPMENGAIEIKTPFEMSAVKAGFYKEKGGSRKQPLVVTPGVPRSYDGQAKIMDHMTPEKRSQVIDVMENWVSGTEPVEAPKDLLDSMSLQERRVASQVAVSLGVAETHVTRANPDGGKVSRAAVRMTKHYPVSEVLHPQSGADIIARKGGNKEMRDIFSDDVPHTPTRQTSLAPVYPFLSPVSPAPQRLVALEEERDVTLTEEERQLWHPAAIKIEEYMVHYATPWEREYFEHQIGLETIRRWIVNPYQMTRKGLGKMKQFL